MAFTSRIILFLALYTIFWRNVSGSIDIFDSFGRKIDTFRDREAPLDDEPPIMEGYILTTDPSDACSPVQEPSFLTNFTYFKFALINGSEACGYKKKIHNAGRAGFDFAVIFDPITGPLSYLDFGFEPHIPAVLISYEDGLIIKSNYLYNNSSIYNYRIRIKPNIPDLSYYMYLFGAVIGICFFVMLLFMMCLLIKCIQERRRSRRNRLSSRQIKQIPTAKFSKGDQYDVCAICLEDYNEGDKLRLLPCSHAYHAKCIDPWLMNNRRNCPLCKRKITFGDSADESDSEDSELTSPAENTPLLTSPSNHGQSWGTFDDPTPTASQNDDATAGPSSFHDSYPNANNNNSRRPLSAPYLDWLRRKNQKASAAAAVVPSSDDAGNGLVSDSESECLLPPPHLSVNQGIPEQSTNQAEVQVNPLIIPSFRNPSFDCETTSNHAASV